MSNRLQRLLPITELFVLIAGCNHGAVGSGTATASSASTASSSSAENVAKREVDPECEEWGIVDHYGGPGTCDQGK